MHGRNGLADQTIKYLGEFILGIFGLWFVSPTEERFKSGADLAPLLES